MKEALDSVTNKLIVQEYEDCYHYGNSSCAHTSKCGILILLIENKYGCSCMGNPLCLYFMLFYNNNYRNQYNLDYLASVLSGLEKELEMLKAPIRNPILPAGLENGDQRCFVNVVLQCLFALYPFKSLLLTVFDFLLYRLHCNTKNHNNVIFWIQRQFAEMALSPRSSVSCSSLCSNLQIDCSTPQGALPLLFRLMQTMQSAAQEQGFSSFSVHFHTISSHLEGSLRLFFWEKKLDDVLLRVPSRFLHSRQFHALSNRTHPP